MPRVTAALFAAVLAALFASGAAPVRKPAAAPSRKPSIAAEVPATTSEVAVVFDDLDAPDAARF